MHTRRIATFLLGAWMGGCLFMAFVGVQNLRAPSLVMTSPPEPVSKLIRQIGWEQTAALLRHAAAEQTRHDVTLWIEAQFPLGLVLLVCLLLATQKRAMPLALCGMMVLIVVFEFRIAPELMYQGRGTDFPPGSNEVGLMTRFWALQQVYFAAEGVKLLCGAVLAGYLFVFRTSRRRKDLLATDAERRSPVTR